MIAQLTGKIVLQEEQYVVIEAAGIGFSVFTPHPYALMMDAVVTLHMYLHWNQEQGPSLFGFAQEPERMLFVLLLGCSGCGPKLALSLLRELSVAEIIKAIYEGNIKKLSSVSGIGAKKAEHISVQLRDKCGLLYKTQKISEGAAGPLQEWHTVTQVLQSLNYTRGEIDYAVQHVKKHYTGKAATFDELMRTALSFLAKKG